MSELVGRDQGPVHSRGVIGRAMNSVISSKLEMHHIDQIDGRFGAKSHFIDGAIMCFRVAMELREEGNLPVIVAVAFDLKWSDEPRGLNFRTLGGLAKQLWRSPPELILIHGARAAELDWVDQAPALDPVRLGVPATHVVLREWCHKPTGEYPRHLWLISFPPG